MERFYFIVNPVAGSGRGKKSFLEARSLLQSRGADVAFAYSEYPGHAVSLARQALDSGETTIVCVGGDGTVREIAGALLQSNALLGFLPSGSGNDLCNSLGISTDVPSAVEVLLKGNQRRLDAATANGTPFFNVAGLGFDVQVLLKTEFYKKKLNGMLPYFLGIISALTHLKPMKLTYTANGQTVQMDCLIFTAANGQCFGGGMRVAPNADLFDGLFDICAVHKVSLFTFLRLLPLFIKGEHLNKKPVTVLRTSSLTVDCSSPCQVELDGEIIENTPISFQMLPGAIRVLVP